MGKTLPGVRAVRDVIKAHGGNISEMARNMEWGDKTGVTRQTIYNWIDHYALRGEVTAARTSMRMVSQDVVFARLMSEDEDKAFDAARFVLLHLKDDGELLGLSPETLRILAEMGISASDAFLQFEAMMKEFAAVGTPAPRPHPLTPSP